MASPEAVEPLSEQEAVERARFFDDARAGRLNPQKFARLDELNRRHDIAGVNVRVAAS